MKYARVVLFALLALVGGVVGSYLIIRAVMMDWQPSPLPLAFIVPGMIIFVLSWFPLTTALGEVKVLRMKSPKYKSSAKLKKLKAERRRAVEKVRTSEDSDYWILEVLGVEKRMAEAKGKNWDPPEHFRDKNTHLF